MKLAIIYSSMHHKNIEKLVNAIAQKYSDVLFTSGQANNDYGKDADILVLQKKCTLLGKYNCR